jgi:hypothetical protein
VPAVGRMIEPANLARFRANAGGLKNRAVFEIPGMLEQVLEKSEKIVESYTAVKS